MNENGYSTNILLKRMSQNEPIRVFVELSEQEDQVAQMIGSGLEAKEVANIRFKSVATIRNQMQSIYEKLEVKNRSGLSIKMMERIFHISLNIDDISDINQYFKSDNIAKKEINATLSIETPQSLRAIVAKECRAAYKVRFSIPKASPIYFKFPFTLVTNCLSLEYLKKKLNALSPTSSIYLSISGELLSSLPV